MLISRTIFSVAYETAIGKPKGVETVKIAAANMEDALYLTRQQFEHPKILLVQDTGQAIFVRE